MNVKNCVRRLSLLLFVFEVFNFNQSWAGRKIAPIQPTNSQNTAASHDDGGEAVQLIHPDELKNAQNAVTEAERKGTPDEITAAKERLSEVKKSTVYDAEVLKKLKANQKAAEAHGEAIETHGKLVQEHKVADQNVHAAHAAHQEAVSNFDHIGKDKNAGPDKIFQAGEAVKRAVREVDHATGKREEASKAIKAAEMDIQNKHQAVSKSKQEFLSAVRLQKDRVRVERSQNKTTGGQPYQAQTTVKSQKPAGTPGRNSHRISPGK